MIQIHTNKNFLLIFLSLAIFAGSFLFGSFFEGKSLFIILTALLSLSFSILLIIVSLYQVFENNTSAFSMTLLGFGGFGFLDVFKYQIAEYDIRILNENTQILTFIYLVLTFLIFFISYKTVKVESDFFLEEDRFFIERYYIIILPMSILLALIFVYYSEIQTNPYFGIIGYFLKAFLILTAYLYFKTRYLNLLIIFIAFIPYIMIDTSRRVFIVVLLAILLIYIDCLYNNHIINLSKKIVIFFMLIAFYLLLNYMRAENNFGDEYKEGDKFHNTKEYALKLKSIDTFYNTGFIIENFPNKFQFYYGETYLSVLVGLIPRSIWQSKPVSLGAPLGMMQKIGSQTFDTSEWFSINQYSLSPGFVGEAYANFGVFGIFVGGILMGISAKFFDNKYRKRTIKLSNLPFIILMISFLLTHRGDFYAATIYNLFIFFFLILFKILLQKNISNH